jgi:hypothetical protein
VDQSLLLRDSRDFPSVDQYRKFVRALVVQLNPTAKAVDISAHRR